MTENKGVLFNIFISIAYLFFLGYVIFRACSVSFTIDEAISFSMLKNGSGFYDSANNHYLNTGLMWIFNALFGMSELSLRMPNVLAFLLYSVYGFKILSKLGNQWMFLIGFVLLIVNPYLIEFFSLARGYGLSLAFMMAAVYYLLREIPDEKGIRRFLKTLIAGLACCILAVYANFGMLNFIITAQFIFLLQFIRVCRKNKYLKQSHIIYAIAIVVVSVALLIPALMQLLRLKELSQLYFGGDNNFVDNSMLSLVSFSAYENPLLKFLFKIIAIFLVATLPAGMLMMLVKKGCASGFRTTLLLVILMVAAPVIEFYLFGSPYPKNRTALVYLPLFGIFITYFIAELYKIFNKKAGITVLSAISGIVLLALSSNFIYCMNTRFAVEWNFDQDTKAVMKTIAGRHNQGLYGNRQLSIANDWRNAASINYYRERYSMDFLNAATRDSINRDADIYFGPSALIRTITIPGVRVVDFFDNTNSFLAEKILPPNPANIRQ